MKAKFLFLLSFTMLLFTTCKNNPKMNEQTRIIPMRDFFKNPEVSYFQLSPSGDKIGFTKPFKNRMNLFVSDLNGKDTVQLTFIEDRDLQGYFWKTETRIIYIKDNGGDENFHLFAIDADGKNQKDLTPFPNVRVQIVDDLIENENEVLIEMNRENPELFDVYRLNIVSGELKLEAHNPGGVSDWLTDHNGVVRVAVKSDGVETALLYRDNAKDNFKEVLKTNFKEAVNPLFFSFDNEFVYATSNLGRDKAAIVSFDIKSGKEKEIIFEHKDVDVESLTYSRKRKVLTTIEYTTAKNEQHFLDKMTEEMYADLESKLGKELEINITSSNRNEDKFLIRTISDRSLGASYFYNAQTKELRKIVDRAPWINPEEMCEMKAVTYKSRDGLNIQAYLTLPHVKELKNLPVVINPHGGPWARDEWGFNPEVQFLANRGYAVLQMNFRGSTGYGRKFWESSFKQWGQTMQNDITDGVNWLIKEGIADPKRVAIYGASYGGYATLAGITFTPNLYACAVDYVGVSNLFTFMNTIPPYWKPFMDMMYEMVGDPKKDSAMMHAASPVFHVDKIKVPLFVAQGANDPRVNKDESDQMVEALKKRNVQVEYMVKNDEGHGFNNEENQFDFYGAMEKFLAKHLGGRMELNSNK